MFFKFVLLKKGVLSPSLFMTILYPVLHGLLLTWCQRFSHSAFLACGISFWQFCFFFFRSEWASKTLYKASITDSYTIVSAKRIVPKSPFSLFHYQTVNPSYHVEVKIDLFTTLIKNAIVLLFCMIVRDPQIQNIHVFMGVLFSIFFFSSPYSSWL